MKAILRPGSPAYVVIGNNHTIAGGERVEIEAAKPSRGHSERSAPRSRKPHPDGDACFPRHLQEQRRRVGRNPLLPQPSLEVSEILLRIRHRRVAIRHKLLKSGRPLGSDLDIVFKTVPQDRRAARRGCRRHYPHYAKLRCGAENRPFCIEKQYLTDCTPPMRIGTLARSSFFRGHCVGLSGELHPMRHRRRRNRERSEKSGFCSRAARGMKTSGDLPGRSCRGLADADISILKRHHEAARSCGLRRKNAGRRNGNDRPAQCLCCVFRSRFGLEVASPRAAVERPALKQRRRSCRSLLLPGCCSCRSRRRARRLSCSCLLCACNSASLRTRPSATSCSINSGVTE